MCEVLACRVCLASGLRLHAMREAGLRVAYEHITGAQVHPTDGLPQYVCYECAALVRRLGAFRDKCLRGQASLHAALATDRQITDCTLKGVDRFAANLVSTLVCIYHHEIHVQGEVKLEVDAAEETSRHSHYDVKDDALLTEIKEENDSDGVPSPLPSVKSFRSDEDDEPLSRHRSDVTTKVKKRKKHKVEKRVVSLRKKIATLHREVVPKDEKVRKTKGRKSFDEEFATVITLSHEEQLEELRKRQGSLNYTNSPYKCSKCYKGFVDDTAYGNHMVRHEPSSGEFTCAICEIHCQSERKLRSHLVAAHARKYACRACAHISNTSNQAREHEKWHKGFTYQCNLCGETFRKSTTHLTHVRLRHPTEFVCDVCGDSFVGKHGLAVHKKRTHKPPAQETSDAAGASPADAGLFCVECDVQFSTAEAWKRHTVTSARHSTNNDFGNGCRVCGDTFASKAELAAHGYAHARRPGAEPPGADGRRPVKCRQCDAEFGSARKCLAHFKRMHLGMKYPIKKNVVCEVCGKKCTSNATLSYHQRTHTGEKPFQCSECPKRFSIRQRLQIHERTHTGERPYPCTVCHKAFRHKPALNRHSRVHTGAKPYECQYCGKTFSQSNSMKLHVHTVHLKLPPPYRSKGGQKIALTTSLPLASAYSAQRL